MVLFFVRLEETLSGGGTSHRVNGIIVQPQVSTVSLQRPVNDVQLKSKKRSITPVDTDLPDYNAGQRLSPPVTMPLQLHYEPHTQIARLTNMV